MMLKLQNMLPIRNVCAVIAVLLFGCAVSAVNAVEYGIDDENELLTVLNFETSQRKVLNLEKDVLIGKDKVFTVRAGDDITFNLNSFNLTGTGNFEFHATDQNTLTKIEIVGSTAGFNGGLKIFDNITLTYNGTYISGDLDILGKDSGDNVTVLFNKEGSGWNAAASTPTFISGSLPASLDTLADDHEGTIIIGGNGVGHLTVNNGNWVKNAETIVGAGNKTEISDVLISGKGTNWYASGSFYIGYEGDGVTKIDEGAQVSAGSIGVGIMPNGDGKLIVTGTGVKAIAPESDLKNKIVYDAAYRTVFKTDELDPLDNTTTVHIFGRNDFNEHGVSQLASQGAGVMELTNGSHLVFDECATETTLSSGSIPKLTLGTGNSFVDKSLVSGALLNRHANNSNTGLIEGTGNLTFKNESVLEGSLKIKMGSNQFESGSIITPGYGMYEYPYINPDDKTFGSIEFDNNVLTFDNTVKIYLDFDVHGDINANKAYANHLIEPNPAEDPLKTTIKIRDGETSDGYLRDRGRDVIKSSGNISLDGDIYFRPQAGYYSEKIDVNFLETDGGNIVRGFDIDRVHIEPSRWFENADITYTNTGSHRGAHLLLDRHQSPFATAGDDFNSRSAGTALDSIYNANDNYSWLHILDWVWLMNDAELQKTVHLLAGEAKASSFYMPLRSQWRYAFDRVNWSRNGNRVYFGTQNNENPKTAKNDLWVAPYYDYLHMHSDGNVMSTTTQRVSFMAGYDRVFTRTPYFGAVSKSAWGFIFGYSQPKLNQETSRIIADDYLLGAHFHTRLYSQYELKLWGGLGAQQYRLTRNVPVPDVNGDVSAKYTGTSWSGSVQIARPFAYRDSFVFRPLAALDLMTINQNSATEKGEYEQIILQYQRSKWTQLLGRIGVKADYAWQQFNLTGSLAYSYLLLGDQIPVSTHRFAYAGGSSFDVRGNDLGRSFLNVSLGTELHLDRLKTSTVFLQYSGDYGKHSNGQTATIGCQKLF